jgi:iron complex transport system substrate-binding protein
MLHPVKVVFVNIKQVAYITSALLVLSLISTLYVYSFYNGQLNDMRVQIDELQSSVVDLQGELDRYRNLTLVDDGGYVLHITSYPIRVLSLAPSITEILFAVNAGDLVMGVTDYCDYPHDFSAWVEAGNITSVGGYWNPNIETIISLEPDLIFAAFDQDELVETLREMGYNVIVLSPDSVDGVLNDILLAGRATDRETEAALLVKDMNRRIETIENKVSGISRPTVYFEIWNDPLWSVGSEGWEHELLKIAGGDNVFADLVIDYFETSSEPIIERDPEVMIFPAGSMGAPFWGSFEQVKTRPGWDIISAVKNNRLGMIDANIVSRPGPRIVEALEEMAKIIHPELFD